MSGASTQFPGGYTVTWRDKYPLIGSPGVGQRFTDDTEVDAEAGGLVLQFMGYGTVILAHQDTAAADPDETCEFDFFHIGWTGKGVKDMDVDRQLVRFVDGSTVCVGREVVEVHMRGTGMIRVFRLDPDDGHSWC